jgi:hypothetical protein
VLKKAGAARIADGTIIKEPGRTESVGGFSNAIPSYFVISGRTPTNNATENLFPTIGLVFQSQVG